MDANTKQAIIEVARLSCGTVLLIVHAVTGVNGLLIGLGAFLIGAPLEVIIKGAKQG